MADHANGTGGPPTRSSEQHRAARKALLSSYAGSVIEWYSFILYGTASALVFGKLFFPNAGQVVGTIAALATFGIGEVSRPIGGVIFGHFGDRIGRKSVLMTTMVLMGIGTFAIGLLPTYGQIGVAAPFMLAALRFVQGLAVGGEWGSAALMAIEHAPSDRRGLWGSIAQLGSSSALLLSTPIFALFAALPEAQFMSWGWRVPFLLSILLAGVGVFIRNRTLETPIFAADQREHGRSNRLPIAEVFSRSRKRVLLAIGLTFGPLGAQMILVVWVTSYAKQIGYSRSVTLTALMLVAVAQLIAVPLFGLITDRIGRRPIYLTGSILLAVNAFSMMWLVNTGVDGLLILGMFMGSFINGMLFGQSAALLAELFPTGSRATGVSVSYQTASVTGSGFGPLIAASLLAAAGGATSTWLVSSFISLICLVAAGCALIAPETRQNDLQVTGDTASQVGRGETDSGPASAMAAG
jgi:MFS family permease